MRYLIFAALVLTLAACGGRASRDRGPVLLFAEGPMSKACLNSDRKARSKALCGCVQAVANRDLSSADQRLAVSFWSDPQRAQDIRQSDVPRHEEFWRRYKAYGQNVERLCRSAA